MKQARKEGGGDGAMQKRDWGVCRYWPADISVWPHRAGDTIDVTGLAFRAWTPRIQRLI